MSDSAFVKVPSDDLGVIKMEPQDVYCESESADNLVAGNGLAGTGIDPVEIYIKSEPTDNMYTSEELAVIKKEPEDIDLDSEPADTLVADNGLVESQIGPVEIYIKSEPVDNLAAECREKWQNLRNVCMRKMKHAPNESGAKKKAYYSGEAMEFCLPCIEASPPSSSGNSPQVPHQEEISQNTDLCGESASLEDSQARFPRSSNPPASARPQESTPALPQTSFHPPSQSPRAKKNLRNEEAATSCQSISKKEALKMFLLSLLPELEEFSDSQIKLFKRRVFNAIDEISTPSQPSCLTLLSPQSDSSTTLAI